MECAGGQGLEILPPPLLKQSLPQLTAVLIKCGGWIKQGKLSNSNRVVTHGFSLMAQGLAIPPTLILVKIMPLLNLVAANVAGWVI